MKLKYLLFNARGNSGFREVKAEDPKSEETSKVRTQKRNNTGGLAPVKKNYSGGLGEGKKTKQNIMQNKTRQDNEAQMGLIRAMIENCECKQNKGLLSFVTLKVKSCF